MSDKHETILIELLEGIRKIIGKTRRFMPNTITVHHEICLNALEDIEQKIATVQALLELEEGEIAE